MDCAFRAQLSILTFRSFVGILVFDFTKDFCMLFILVYFSTVNASRTDHVPVYIKEGNNSKLASAQIFVYLSDEQNRFHIVWRTLAFDLNILGRGELVNSKRSNTLSALSASRNTSLFTIRQCCQ